MSSTTNIDQVKILHDAAEVADELGDRQLATDTREAATPIARRPPILEQIRKLEAAAVVCDELEEVELAARLRQKAAALQAGISIKP